ncbi:MAG: flagellar hook-associated protein FlgL [Cryobacterium sp.]
MITRITGQTQMRQAQRNLQENMAQLSRLQEQASTLKAINRPSDDPTAAASALAVRVEQAAVVQYSRNAGNGNDWLTTLDSTLSATTAIMNRVRDLTVQGANEGALSPTAKEALAVELDGLREDLLTQANTSYLGRTVFAGNSDAGVAFAENALGVLQFQGTSDSSVTRRISTDVAVRVDADGGAVFGDEDGSVFALIDTISAALRSGAGVSDYLGDIDSRMALITGEHAVIGARQNQMDRAQQSLLAQVGTLESRRSSIEDIDLGEVILDLKLQETSYQAALAVTARVLQPTLMDFLS